MLTIFAPAKINLNLHITGKRGDGYHLLDSLVSFADIGDTLFFEPSRSFELHIKGPFAHDFDDLARLSSPASSNLVARAAWLLADTLVRELNVAITLQKNLPLASGIGGGSADAAATIWGLCQYWNLSLPDDYLHALALKLGSDVPVCLKSQNVTMRGIGDEFGEAPDFPEIPVVLVWPNCGVATQAAYKNLNLASFSAPALLKPSYPDIKGFMSDLAFETRNDMTDASVALCPEIETALKTILPMAGCLLSRMSGSGSTVFGLFASEEDASAAVKTLRAAHPDWWVQSGWLNRIARY